MIATWVLHCPVGHSPAIPEGQVADNATLQREVAKFGQSRQLTHDGVFAPLRYSITLVPFGPDTR
jgi:hypothetical protein